MSRQEGRVRVPSVWIVWFQCEPRSAGGDLWSSNPVAIEISPDFLPPAWVSLVVGRDDGASFLPVVNLPLLPALCWRLGAWVAV